MSRPKTKARSQDRRAAGSPAVAPSIEVRLGWLLGALGLLVVAASCCAYLSLCLLFVQGQWQMLYRPARAVSSTPASVGLGFTAVAFGVDGAGVPELSGWLIPGAAGAPLAGITVIYLHDGSGSLSDSLPELARIHALGCAVLAFDYRGYGASATAHPSEAGMIADARAAVGYLADTRHLPVGSLVLWGRGIGATIAAEASVEEPRLPMVLEEANLPALWLLRGDPRTRFLPVRLLLRDRLDAASALRASRAPKLFLGSSARTLALYALSAGPKERDASGDAGAVRAFLAGARAGQPGVTSLIP